MRFNRTKTCLTMTYKLPILRPGIAAIERKAAITGLLMCQTAGAIQAFFRTIRGNGRKSVEQAMTAENATFSSSIRTGAALRDARPIWRSRNVSTKR
jgi:hypothetical protein